MVTRTRGRLILKVLVIGVVVSAVASWVIVKAKRVHGQNDPPCKSEWVTALRHGVEAEAPCPRSFSDISLSVSSLSSFIRYRSGIAIPGTTQERLAKLERETWPGSCGEACRLNRQDIKNIITAEYLSLVVTLTDSQIGSMTKSFQMVPAWVPPNRNADLQLTPSAGNVAAVDFVDGLEQLRGGNLAALVGTQAEIGTEVDHACDVLAYALPAGWNVTDYSPYQMFVITYSLTSGDRLGDSRSECEERLSRIEGFLTQRGFNAPSAGRVLWGEAGYLYTRPTSILFSDAVQIDLLGRYAAVHGLQ